MGDQFSDSFDQKAQTRRHLTTLEQTLRRLVTTLGPTLSSLLALLGVWWFLTSRGLVPPETLPSPGLVYYTAFTLLGQPYGPDTLLGHASITCFRVLAGFGLGVACGLLFGILLKFLPRVHVLVDPLFSFLRPIPAFAFITLLLLTLGVGEGSKIALLFIAVFPAMTIYTDAAMNALPIELEESARMLGSRGAGLFVHVRFPAALPDLLAGSRVLLAVSWTAMMGAELVAAESGLGWMIWSALKHSRTDVVFVGVIMIAVIAALMDYCIVLGSEALTGGWRAHVRGQW